MAQTLFFNKDVGVILKFVLNKPDGTAQDLTGGTVTLLVVADATGVAVTGSPFATTITDAVNGKVEKTVAANDFPTGMYRAQLKAVVGANTFHSDVFFLHVSAALA